MTFRHTQFCNTETCIQTMENHEMHFLYAVVEGKAGVSLHITMLQINNLPIQPSQVHENTCCRRS